MRVVCVTPNFEWDTSPLPTDTLRPPITPALEWSYLSRGLGKHFAGCINSYSQNATLTAAVDDVLSWDPTHVVISTVASLLYYRCPPFTVKAAEAVVGELRLRDYQGIVIVVGPHASHSPAWTLQKVGADIAWRGSTDVRLARDLVADPTLRSSAHAYYVSRSAPSTMAIDLAADLPEADLTTELPSERYRPHAWLLDDEEAHLLDARFGLLLESSRGCPWSCSYCAKGPIRDRFGRRSIDILERELQSATELGWEYCFFADETFNIADPSFSDVLRVLETSGLRFGFQGRPDLISEDIASRLGAAGCTYVELGIDIADDADSRTHGRTQSLRGAESGVEACKRHIPIVRYNRLNFTTADYVSMYPEFASSQWTVPVDPVYPYPGAALGQDLMIRYGRTGFDWEFAERYSWWLRLEVRLQRDVGGYDRPSLLALQHAFLGLDEALATAFAGYLVGIADDAALHSLNKSVRGRGGSVHTTGKAVDPGCR